MARWLLRTLKNHGSPSGALDLDSICTRQPVSLLALLQLKLLRRKAEFPEFPVVEFIPSASSVSTLRGKIIRLYAKYEKNGQSARLRTGICPFSAERVPNGLMPVSGKCPEGRFARRFSKFAKTGHEMALHPFSENGPCPV